MWTVSWPGYGGKHLRAGDPWLLPKIWLSRRKKYKFGNTQGFQVWLMEGKKSGF